jgi:hypothetical protein
MATATEQTIVPPSQTTGGNAPDADEVAPEGVEPTIVEPSIADNKKAEAAMNPMQAVHDYEETKRA